MLRTILSSWVLLFTLWSFSLTADQPPRSLIEDRYKERVKTDSMDSFLKDKAIIKSFEKTMTRNLESPTNPQNFALSIAVLVFGIILVICSLILILKIQQNFVIAFQVLIISIIATGSLFLITAGFDEKQITPVVGLFGTIIGFALGKANGNKNSIGDGKQNSSNKAEGSNQSSGSAT